MKKPTVDEIRKLAQNYKDYYNQLRLRQAIDNDFYELDYKAGVPDIYQQITTDTARRWVEEGLKKFTLDNPIATVPPRKNVERYRKTEGNIEAFYNGWLASLASLQPDPVKQGAKYLLLRGEEYFKIQMDDSFYGAEARTKAEKEQLAIDRLNNFPLLVSTPDPMNVYPSTISRRLQPLKVCEWYLRTVEDVREDCERNNWHWDEGSGDRKANETVLWFEYWSDEWRSFMVGGSLEDMQPIIHGDVVPNVYRFVPYIHTYSGYGSMDREGRPEYLARSIIFAKADLIKMQTRILSQTDTMVARFAWPHRDLVGDMEAIEQAFGDKIQLSLSPDVIGRLPEGVEIKTVEGESPPAGVFQHLATVSSMADPPPGLRQGVRGGVTSGYGMNILDSDSKAEYKAPFKAHEDALAELLGLGARMVEKVIQQGVGIKTIKVQDGNSLYGEERVKPEDINGYYSCKVELLTDSPEANDLRRDLGNRMQAQGVISHRTNLMKYQAMSAKEAEDEMAETLAEEILKQDPNLRAAIGRDALRRLGMKQAEQEIENTEAQAKAGLTQQKQGAAQQGPVMKGRNGPEQVMPVALQAEQAGQQAMMR